MTGSQMSSLILSSSFTLFYSFFPSSHLLCHMSSGVCNPGKQTVWFAEVMSHTPSWGKMQMQASGMLIYNTKDLKMHISATIAYLFNTHTLTLTVYTWKNIHHWTIAIVVFFPLRDTFSHARSVRKFSVYNGCLCSIPLHLLWLWNSNGLFVVGFLRKSILFWRELQELFFLPVSCLCSLTDD